MSLALGAIILYFLFIVPSLFFHRLYYSGEFSKQYFKSSPFELFLSAIIPGVLFQIVYYGLVTYLTDYRVDFVLLGKLVLGSDEKDLFLAFASLQNSLFPILLYNLTLWLLLALLGLLAKFIIRINKLDRLFGIFRYRNHWHYLLSGEILDFPEFEGRHSDIEVTYLNVLVTAGNSNFLYSGILERFQLTSEGSGLDYILLSNVERREIIPGSDPKISNPINFAGDLFQIPYSKIMNINIHFIRFT